MGEPAPPSSDGAAEALMTASRALIGIAIRAVNNAPADITLPQHRLMVLLASGGPQTVGSLAEQLAVNPSNASRLCDRLQKIGLVSRERSALDGRAVDVSLTASGQRILDGVSEDRRREIERVLTAMTGGEVRTAVRALSAFNLAAHEIPDQDWSAHAV